MGLGFKQPFVGEKRSVTSLKAAAEETTRRLQTFFSFIEGSSWRLINGAKLEKNPQGSGRFES